MSALPFFQQAYALFQANDVLQAERAIERYVQLMPDCTAGLSLKAIILGRQRRDDEAQHIWQTLVAQEPDNAVLHANYGQMLLQAKRYSEAEAVLHKAVALQSDYADAHLNLGMAYWSQKHIEPALHEFDEAIRIQPTAQAYFNKARLLQDRFDWHNALACYRHAIELNPKHVQAHANLLFSMYYAVPFDIEAARIEAIRLGALMTNGIVPRTEWRNTPDAQKVLRIGLVSGDFRRHPVAWFFKPIAQALGAQRIELYAYVNTTMHDEVTREIQSHCTKWTVIEAMSDETVAGLIYDDAIDILIDMAGHSAGNRLLVFAHKPAPIQVAWLGYFATTGLSAMDYVIADETCVPAAEQRYFVEQVRYLPESRLFLFQPDGWFLPASNQVEHPFTFGCFQELSKINDDVLQVWRGILTASPDAFLRIQTARLDDEQVKNAFIARLERCGIEVSRVLLKGRMNYAQYLQSYADVDVLLDTFPYPGGTTTVEALWMGVPTLTLSQAGMLGRQGEGLLRLVGLEHFVCHNVAEYTQRAVICASNHSEVRAQLRALREILPERCANARAANAVHFASDFERVLRGMWEDWCEKN